MRKLILKMSISVDGFVGDSNSGVDWIFKTHDDAAAAWTIARVSEAGIHIMGSKTFRDMASYWPTSPEPFAPPMNEIPKGVFTIKGLKTADPKSSTGALKSANQNLAAQGLKPTDTPSSAVASWANARVFTGNLAENIKLLKQEDGKPIVAHGGAGFAQSLIATGLIDEYQLLVHPVALGSGMPIFTKLAQPLYLELIEVKTFKKGTAAHIYRPAN